MIIFFDLTLSFKNILSNLSLIITEKRIITDTKILKLIDSLKCFIINTPKHIEGKQ